MNQNKNTQNQFSNAIRELQIGKLLRRSNISKSCGVSAYKVFQFLLLLIFQGKNLFRFLNSKRKDQAISKNTYYRFLNDTSFNWTKFILLLSAKVAYIFSSLIKPNRVKVLVLDDSVVKRNHSKSVELLARVYDHVEHKFQKGVNLLSSAKKSNHYQEISDKIDHHTDGYKTRKESLMAKPDAAILLIRRALYVGVQADYVLMDT